MAHHVQNSQHLASELEGITVDENEILNSHDVVSLFTNTPVDKALEVIKDRLHKHKAWREVTQLEIDDIIELLEFILTTTYFCFRGQSYCQGSVQPWVARCLPWWKIFYGILGTNCDSDSAT